MATTTFYHQPHLDIASSFNNANHHFDINEIDNNNNSINSIETDVYDEELSDDFLNEEDLFNNNNIFRRPQRKHSSGCCYFYRNNVNNKNTNINHSSSSSSNKSYYKALNTARLRKASSVLHQIIVESAYENMTNPDEAIGCKTTITSPKSRINNSVSSLTSSTSSVDDYDENENETFQNGNNANKVYNNNTNSHEESDNHKIRCRSRGKKVYNSRKHHSDYDIVYLNDDQCEQDAVAIDNEDADVDDDTKVHPHRRLSYHGDEIDSSARRLIERRRVQKNFSKSETNLVNSTTPLSGHGLSTTKSSSHVDITSTQMYKDIYADNLRQYGFLLAKQLGISNRSPDQLRKTYQKARKKALERREQSNTSFVSVSRDHLDSNVTPRRERSSTSASHDGSHEQAYHQRFPSQSNLSVSASDLQAGNKYTRSLTDISNVVILEKHKKSTVNRRKTGAKLPRDQSKRLSAPLMDTVTISGNMVYRNSLLRIQAPKGLSSLSVPDLSTEIHSSSPDDSEYELAHDHELSSMSKRTLSEETLRRKSEAQARQELRMARLRSFEGVLSQANTWMKDAKAKSHEHLASTPMKRVHEESCEDNKLDNDVGLTMDKVQQNDRENLTTDKTEDQITRQDTQPDNYVLDKSYV